eukprot:3937745-Rhodomonas_salina.2
MAHPQSGSPAQRTRKYGLLSEEAVLQIFMRRPSRNVDGVFEPSSGSSHRLAAMYGVSERSIREIWNRRCWANLTRPLMTDAEVAAKFGAKESSEDVHGLAKQRRVGRPKGSKSTRKATFRRTALPPSSPPDLRAHPSGPLAPPLVIDFAEAKHAAEFNDPFQNDWECALSSLELGTMMWFSDLATATLQDCDENWLRAVRDTLESPKRK